MDSTLHKIYFTAESTYGTTPASPAWTPIRHTGVSLGLTRSSLVSAEMRSDRQVADWQPGTRQAGGDISAELNYGNLDKLFEAALLGTWAAKTAPYTASTISADNADNSINDSASAFPLLSVGDVVAITGFTGLGDNNHSGRVVSSTTSKIVLSGITLTNDAAGEAVTITPQAQTVTVGTTRRSFSLLRNFTDDAVTPFHRITGAEVNTLKVSLKADGLVEASFTFLAKDTIDPAADAPASSSYVSESTGNTFNFAGGTLSIDGTASAVVTDFSFTLENGLAPRFVIGSGTTLHPSVARSNVTGQLVVYFESAALLTAFTAATAKTLSLVLTDTALNRYVIDFPKVFFTGAQPDTKGQGPVMLTIPFQAVYDATNALKSVRMTRVATL